jgi:lysophospholipase L1-like esterase
VTEAGVPRLLLIGDSIRLGYAPHVATRLEREQPNVRVFSPSVNGADSANVLRQLDGWLAEAQPHVVHLNCGLHDLKLDKTTREFQVPLAEYEANLNEIVRRMRATGLRGNSLVFATTTPIIDERHAQRGAAFDRYEADVLRYNEVAVRAMTALGVPLNDLHAVVSQNAPAALMSRDGTHYTDTGYTLLADAVVTALAPALAAT